MYALVLNAVSGHLYCKECILSFMREHPGSGCPQCALGFTTVQGDVSDNPEHVLGSLYAPMTTQDESDEILEDIVASSWCATHVSRITILISFLS